MSDYVNKAYEDTLVRIFHAHEEVSYIAVMNDKLGVVAQKGFLDFHPAKLEKLHVQAALLVKMCSVWAESFGNFDYACASFMSTYEVMVAPLSEKLQMLVVVPHKPGINLKAIKDDVAAFFRSMK